MENTTEMLQQLAKDLKSPILEADFFEYTNKDNYECFFKCINGKTGHGYKFSGDLEVKYKISLERN